jgi:hypothetical protein
LAGGTLADHSFDSESSRDFDVLAIIDHTVSLDDPLPSAVDPWTWPAYAKCVREEAERAAREHGLLGTSACSSPLPPNPGIVTSS